MTKFESVSMADPESQSPGVLELDFIVKRQVHALHLLTCDAPYRHRLLCARVELLRILTEFPDTHRAVKNALQQVQTISDTTDLIAQHNILVEAITGIILFTALSINQPLIEEKLRQLTGQN